jgi:hypothetical protein
MKGSNHLQGNTRHLIAVIGAPIEMQAIFLKSEDQKLQPFCAGLPVWKNPSLGAMSSALVNTAFPSCSARLDRLPDRPEKELSLTGPARFFVLAVEQETTHLRSPWFHFRRVPFPAFNSGTRHQTPPKIRFSHLIISRRTCAPGPADAGSLGMQCVSRRSAPASSRESSFGWCQHIIAGHPTG